MKRAQRSAVLGLVALAAWTSVAEATEEAEIITYRLLSDRIVESAPLLRGICAEELQEGVRLGRWSAEEKREGDEVLRAIFDGKIEGGPLVSARWEEPPRSRYPVSPLGRWSGLTMQMERERDAAPATAVLFDWLEQRARALDALRVQSGAEIARLSLAAIERGWLAARNEGELRPTVALLRLAQIESYQSHAQQWRAAVTDPEARRRPSLSASLRLQTADPEVARLIEFWSLLASREPLLLPAADADFASYARFCILADLLRDHVAEVLARPAVVACLEGLRSRFRAEVLAIERSLDEAILQDLPAAECERRLARLMAMDFVEPPRLERPQRHSPPAEFPSSFSSNSIDYRDVALPKLGKFAQAERDVRSKAAIQLRKSWWQILRLPEVRADYASWQALRQAGESDSVADQAAAATRLTGALGSFRSAVADHVKGRLAQLSAAKRLQDAVTLPVVADAETDPVAMLIAALENLAIGNEQPEIKRLAAAWRASRQQELLLDGAAGQELAQCWTRVFAVPGRASLGRLRERAVGTLLNPGSADSASIETLLRERLDAALRRGDLTEGARILAVAQAGGVLPWEEGVAYSGEIEALRQIPSGDASRDRGILRQLIQNAGARPAGEIAAERLKQMR